MLEYFYNVKFLSFIECDFVVWCFEKEVGVGEVYEDIIIFGGFKFVFFDFKIWVFVWCMGMV